MQGRSEDNQLVQAYAASAKEIVRRYNPPAGIERGAIESLLKAEEFLGNVGTKAFGFFLSSATVISYIVVAPVIAYYMLRDMNRWRQRALVAMSRYPLPYVDLVTDIDRVITGFVRGQSIVAASVAAMIWVASYALGLRYGAALGLIAGLENSCPSSTLHRVTPDHICRIHEINRHRGVGSGGCPHNTVDRRKRYGS